MIKKKKKGNPARMLSRKKTLFWKRSFLMVHGADDVIMGFLHCRLSLCVFSSSREPRLTWKSTADSKGKKNEINEEASFSMDLGRLRPWRRRNAQRAAIYSTSEPRKSGRDRIYVSSKETHSDCCELEPWVAFAVSFLVEARWVCFKVRFQLAYFIRS